MASSSAEQLFEFPWETLQTIVDGKSAIDIPRLQVFHLGEAEGFLEAYGFRWDDPFHSAELETHRVEALAFLQEELLRDEQMAIPEEIREQRDVRRLLLWASERGSVHNPRQKWSCALLRIMHTLAHCGSYFNEHFGEEIRAQILDRFQPHLHESEEGLSLGSGSDAIFLSEFHIKRSKSKNSVVMKLLHKSENVASDVFDRIGIRFVTLDRFDALRVVRYLRSHNIVMFANMKPSRSRNTLVDLDWLQQEIADRASDRDSDLPHDVDDEMDDALEVATFRARLDAQPFHGPPHSSHNPHSARKYHAIQFTCRQMIRVNNPYTPEITARLDAASLAQPELRSTCNRLLRTLSAPSQIRFFFPYEVQILDKQSFDLSRVGDAAHAEYKRRQRETVKQRVLGALLHK